MLYKRKNSLWINNVKHTDILQQLTERQNKSRSSTYTETCAGRKEKGSKAEIIKTIRNEQGREEIKKRFKNRAEDIKGEG